MSRLARTRALLRRLDARRVKAMLALSGLIAVSMTGNTLALSIDNSTLNLGDNGLGNPNKFTVEVFNETTSAWVETVNVANSATFANNGKPINTKAGSHLTIPEEVFLADKTATFTVKFRLKADAPKGQVIPQLVPASMGSLPNCTVAGAKPALCYMNFTAVLPTSAGNKKLSGHTAASLNTSLKLPTYKMLPNPGEEQIMTLNVWFDKSIMSDPGVASMRGQDVAFGIRFDAESSVP